MEALNTADSATVTQSSEAIFRDLESRDWASDADFQSGLQSIIGPLRSTGAPTEQLLETETRAKVFYYSQQTNHNISYDDYVQWKRQQRETEPATSDHAAHIISGETVKSAQEPYPASFDAIVELIASGRTSEIPGIRDIPLVINEEKPAPAAMPAKVKPWERGCAQADSAAQ